MRWPSQLRYPKASVDRWAPRSYAIGALQVAKASAVAGAMLLHGALSPSVASGPAGWHQLPEVTAFSMAKRAAARSQLSARVITSTSVNLGTGSIQTIEWWEVNRTLASVLMELPANAVEQILIYCVRVQGIAPDETCYGPFSPSR